MMEDMLMIRRCFCVLPAVVVLAALSSAPVFAGDDKGSDGGKCGTITKTICCPEYTTEKRTVECCVYKNEERTREVTCYKQVPVTETKTCNYTVMVPETKTRTEK